MSCCCKSVSLARRIAERVSATLQALVDRSAAAAHGGRLVPTSWPVADSGGTITLEYHH